MARIDIFSDLEEVLQHTAIDKHYRIADTEVMIGAVHRFNGFIHYLQEQGHDVTIVPVTSYREHMDEPRLRKWYEDIGVMKDLHYAVYKEGSRNQLVEMRKTQKCSDAYVIFDDTADAYTDKTNLIHVVPNDRKRIGITVVDINSAKIRIAHQLNAAGLPYRVGAALHRNDKRCPADDLA